MAGRQVAAGLADLPELQVLADQAAREERAEAAREELADFPASAVPVAKVIHPEPMDRTEAQEQQEPQDRAALRVLTGPMERTEPSVRLLQMVSKGHPEPREQTVRPVPLEPKEFLATTVIAEPPAAMA